MSFNLNKDYVSNDDIIELREEEARLKSKKDIQSIKNVIKESNELNLTKAGRIFKIKDKNDLSIYDLYILLKNKKKLKHKTIYANMLKGGWVLTKKHNNDILEELYFKKDMVQIYVLHFIEEYGFPNKYSLYVIKAKEYLEYTI